MVRPKLDYRFKWNDGFLGLYSKGKYVGGLGKKELIKIITGRFGKDSVYKESVEIGEKS